MLISMDLFKFLNSVLEVADHILTVSLRDFLILCLLWYSFGLLCLSLMVPRCTSEVVESVRFKLWARGKFQTVSEEILCGREIIL